MSVNILDFGLDFDIGEGHVLRFGSGAILTLAFFTVIFLLKGFFGIESVGLTIALTVIQMVLIYYNVDIDGKFLHTVLMEKDKHET